MSKQLKPEDRARACVGNTPWLTQGWSPHVVDAWISRIAIYIQDAEQDARQETLRQIKHNALTALGLPRPCPACGSDDHQIC